MKEIDSYR
jgi:serine/threonine protein kinase